MLVLQPALEQAVSRAGGGTSLQGLVGPYDASGSNAEARVVLYGLPMSTGRIIEILDERQQDVALLKELKAQGTCVGIGA